MSEGIIWRQNLDVVGRESGFSRPYGNSCSGLTSSEVPYYSVTVEFNQEPLDAPFLNGLFSRGFPSGKTAH